MDEFQPNALSIRYDILSDVNRILVQYYHELDADNKKIVVEISNRLLDHFYGDVC